MGDDNFQIFFSQKPNLEDKITHLPRTQIYDHPLRVVIQTVTESRISRRGFGSSSTNNSTGSSTPILSTSSTVILDPLGAISRPCEDPLSQFAREASIDSSIRNENNSYESNSSQNENDTRKKSRKASEISIEPWANRRGAILSKFTTSEKLSIVTSFLTEGDKVVVKAQSTAVDKMKTRLEQLDEFEEGSIRHEYDLTQQEYTVRIEQLNNELVIAWKGEQKVRALKIAIQCAKLLVDTSVIQFYPSKFVLITDILDIFGKLVYERLRVKSECNPNKVDSLTQQMLQDSAKETCRNWFYKIASIRELVPRLYVEMSILKSYTFLTTSKFSNALMRLSHMIRGIGNPLVAIYARCYLCRVGMSVSTTETDRRYLAENFSDFLATHNQVYGNCGFIRADLERQKVDFHAYLTLYTPALDWILQTVLEHFSTTAFLDQLLEQCNRLSHKGLLLNTIMASFKPALISEKALEIVDMIIENNDGNGRDFPKYVLFRTLGLCLSVVPPPQEQRRKVLNNVWSVVSSLTNPADYIQCAEIWVRYTVANFSSREINTFLGDIIKHLTPNRAFENYHSQLQTILDHVVAHSNSQDFESLLLMPNFLPLLDLFQRENVRINACRTVINAFAQQKISTNDPIVINGLMFISRILHDSVNALTVDDERRQIGNLICSFVKGVSFNRDFESQLNFYVEARAAFTNLDAVLAQLVQCVNRLSVETRKIVKGNHSRKTGAFVRACAAYCYITIPSIGSIFTQLELYLISGQVALFNQCLGQADACFKAALTLIADLPKTITDNEAAKQHTTEQFLVGYVKVFLSTLVVVPDSPDQSALFLLKSLLSILQNFTWPSFNMHRAYIYLNVIDLLSILAQEKYPYHIEKVESNDTLYGSDKKFLMEIDKVTNLIIEELLGYLKQLGMQSDQIKTQTTIALELCIRILLRGDFKNNSVVTLARNLWQLVQKNRTADSKYVKRTLEYLIGKADKESDRALHEFLLTLQV